MRHLALMTAISLLSAGAFAQLANDSCATAAFLSPGGVLAGSNVGATTGPDPVATCGGMSADVWFVFSPPCSGVMTASTCNPGTAFDTVIAIWDGTNGCGTLVPLGCNDDSCTTTFLSSTVTFPVTAGSVYYVSVGGYSGATGYFAVGVTYGANGISLAFSNLGPGTIGFSVSGAPFDQYLTVMSLDQGAYPNGWFFGIDVLPFELDLMLSWGYPVSGSLDACGGSPSDLSAARLLESASTRSSSGSRQEA